jgi:hypothetical protein
MEPVLDPQALGFVVGDAVKVGTVFTVIVIEVESRQLPLLPITVYVVVTVGVTLMELPLADVLHVKLPAPVAVSVVEVPAHKVCEVAATETVGIAFTVTVHVEGLPAQPLLPVPVTV